MMSKTAWIIFAVLAVAVLGGLIALSRNDRVDVSTIDANVAQAATSDNGDIGDHTLGSDSPTVTIIEYADYQCPGCSSAAPVMKSVVEEVGDDGVQFIFRNFPLTSIHPNARAASAAAEAAGFQGKYWEMHDLLFAEQSAWSGLSSDKRTDTLVGYASRIGLDTKQFEQDLTSDRIAQKIDFDSALGRKKNVSGTPAIFVNGESVSDIRVKDGKVSTDDEAQPIWTDGKSFIDVLIQPKLESNSN